MFLFLSLKPKDLKDVVLDDLIAETQYSLDKADESAIRMVWWVPTEFWGAVYSQDASIDDKTADEIVEMLEGYSMVIVIDGEMGTFGELTSVDADKIRGQLTLTNKDNKVFKPLKEKEISFNAKMVLNIIKPIFANLLGTMGESMEVFMFTDDGKAIIDPYEVGGGIKYDEVDVELNLPLSALLKGEKCPEDGAEMNAKWNYCPIHGDKLK